MVSYKAKNLEIHTLQAQVMLLIREGKKKPNFTVTNHADIARFLYFPSSSHIHCYLVILFPPSVIKEVISITFTQLDFLGLFSYYAS